VAIARGGRLDAGSRRRRRQRRGSSSGMVGCIAGKPLPSSAAAPLWRLTRAQGAAASSFAESSFSARRSRHDSTTLRRFRLDALQPRDGSTGCNANADADGDGSDTWGCGADTRKGELPPGLAVVAMAGH